MNCNKLFKSDFIGFAKTTFSYFSNKERILDNPSAVINIVRMMGILPLTKENFSVIDDNTRKLSHLILNKVSEQLGSIFKKMNAAKWNVFKDGLAFLMTIEILNDDDRTTKFDFIDLLNQIPTNKNQKNQVANGIFQELMKLNLPIERTNWIELLSFIDDEKLNFDCLHLATTFDHIRFYLERIVPLYEINDSISQTITTILDNKLNNLTCT
jgi:heme oxygenase